MNVQIREHEKSAQIVNAVIIDNSFGIIEWATFGSALRLLISKYYGGGYFGDTEHGFAVLLNK